MSQFTLPLQSPHLALHTSHSPFKPQASQLDLTAHACQSLTLQASRFSCHNSHLAAFTSLLVYHTTDPLPRTVHFTRHNSYFKSTPHTSNRSSQTSVLGRHTTDLTSYHDHLALHSSNLTLDAPPDFAPHSSHLRPLTAHPAPHPWIATHLTPHTSPRRGHTSRLSRTPLPTCH